jgi:hypothetical protein
MCEGITGVWDVEGGSGEGVVKSMTTQLVAGVEVVWEEEGRALPRCESGVSTTRVARFPLCLVGGGDEVFASVVG